MCNQKKKNEQTNSSRANARQNSSRWGEDKEKGEKGNFKEKCAQEGLKPCRLERARRRKERRKERRNKESERGLGLTNGVFPIVILFHCSSDC